MDDKDVTQTTLATPERPKRPIHFEEWLNELRVVRFLNPPVLVRQTAEPVNPRKRKRPDTPRPSKS